MSNADPQDAEGPYDAASRAADRLVSALGSSHEVAVVAGSGWGEALAGMGRSLGEVPFAELGEDAAPTVAGHVGRALSLEVGGRRALVLAGRLHLYEGHRPAAVVRLVRAAVLAGVRVVILTNAAGAINPTYGVGQPILIADHLNLTGASPLSGPPPPPGVPSRFVDLGDLYAARLRALARQVEPTLVEGVYAGLRGPHYETPAEIRMLAAAGADLVGMSTVLEAIAARHLGAEVLGLSLVTNPAAGVGGQSIDHSEVLAAGAASGPQLGKLVAALIAALPAEPVSGG